ncbi:MAG: ROK family protein [Candidatus Saganbacteria bacterium]|nr:ROK family protein [Candidatus Saganbacteria bacterium]
MNTSACRRLMVADIGGGTFRRALFQIEAGKRATMIGKPEAIELKFSGKRDLIGFSLSQLRDIPDDQHRIAISIAGPVDTGAGIIRKLTNQGGIEKRDIPYSAELKTAFKSQAGKDVDVILINDGEAGAWAEFSPQGALKDLKTGDLGLALIIGHGIGGRLYRKTASGIEQVPGAFEPGHFLIHDRMIDGLGLLRYYAPFDPCGCGITGQHGDVCFETLAKGPSIYKIISGVISNIRIVAASARTKDQIFNIVNPAMTETELRSNVLIKQVMQRLGMNISKTDTGQIIKSASDHLNYHDVDAVMGKTLGNEPICKEVLTRIAYLLAFRLEALQRGYDDHASPITFALIGGVGVSKGAYLTRDMTRFSADAIERPSWGKAPKYVTGAFPSQETNLWGSLFYMINNG